MRRYLRTHGRAPLAIAGFLAFPLFFASLMAASLRVDRPGVTTTTSAAGKTTVHYHQTAGSTELKIWALALVPVAILLSIGVLCMVWRRLGFHVVCLSAAVLAYLVTLPLESWVKGHSSRWPTGFDLVPDDDPSNLLLRGEWEHNARETVVSLAHWTIGLAAGIAAIAALLELKRRLGRRHAPTLPA